MSPLNLLFCVLVVSSAVMGSADNNTDSTPEEPLVITGSLALTMSAAHAAAMADQFSNGTADEQAVVRDALETGIAGGLEISQSMVEVTDVTLGRRLSAEPRQLDTATVIADYVITVPADSSTPIRASDITSREDSLMEGINDAMEEANLGFTVTELTAPEPEETRGSDTGTSTTSGSDTGTTGGTGSTTGGTDSTTGGTDSTTGGTDSTTGGTDSTDSTTDGTDSTSTASNTTESSTPVDGVTSVAIRTMASAGLGAVLLAVGAQR